MLWSLAYFIVFFVLFFVRGPGIINSLLSEEYKVHRAGIVIVSGASSGIGRHAALELANSGYTVYAGVRSEKDVLSIRSEEQKLKNQGLCHLIA